MDTRNEPKASTHTRPPDMDKYRQRGQPNTDTPPPRVHIHARNGGFLRRNGRFCSRNSGFLRQKAPFMQQEAKASTPPALIWTTWTTEHRHHRPALRLYHTRPALIWTTWTIRTTYEREQPPRPCGALHAPRVCIYNRTENPKASTPPEYGQRGQYGQRGHRGHRRRPR